MEVLQGCACLSAGRVAYAYSMHERLYCAKHCRGFSSTADVVDNQMTNHCILKTVSMLWFLWELLNTMAAHPRLAVHLDCIRPIQGGLLCTLVQSVCQRCWENQHSLCVICMPRQKQRQLLMPARLTAVHRAHLPAVIMQVECMPHGILTPAITYEAARRIAQCIA